MGRHRTRPDTLHLPAFIRKKGARYYVDGINPRTGKRSELAAGKTVDEAIRFARTIGITDDEMRQYAPPPGFIVGLLARARTNARSKGLVITLSRDDVQRMLDTNDRCPISGVRFEYSRAAGERFRPWVPSIDRIDPQHGYVLENCRLVCAYVNLAMNQFGSEVFVSIARGVVNFARKQPRTPPKRGILEQATTLQVGGSPEKLADANCESGVDSGGETGIRTLDRLPYT